MISGAKISHFSIILKSDQDALIIFVNKMRFGALTGSPPNVRRIDSRDQSVREELPQWQLDSTDRQDTSLCVNNPSGAGLSLQKPTEVKCMVVTHLGLGQISEEEIMPVKVYGEFFITVFERPKPILKRIFVLMQVMLLMIKIIDFLKCNPKFWDISSFMEYKSS